MTITVITKDNCKDCARTEGILDDKGIDHDILNAEHDAEVLDFVVNVIGVRQMPVVIIHEGDWRDFRPEPGIDIKSQPFAWSGIRYDRLVGLDALLKEFAPVEVAA